MPKVPHSGEYKNHPVLVGGVDDFLIVAGATGFHQGNHAGLGERIGPVTEWDKGFAGRYRSDRAIPRLADGPLGGSDPTLIADADADGCAFLHDHDAVGFAVSRHRPGQAELIEHSPAGLRLRHHGPIAFDGDPGVGLLNEGTAVNLA